jgi:hypothetical protein
MIKQIICLRYIIQTNNTEISEVKKKLESLEKSISYDTETMTQELKVLILTLQADAIRTINIVNAKEQEKKLPGANRKPRTDEEKRLASEKRKAWWEKKRQEQKINIPDAIILTPPQEPVLGRASLIP